MFISKDELDRRKEESNNLTARMKVPSEVVGPNIHLDTSKFKNDGTQRSMPVYSPEIRALAAATTIIAGPEAAHEITGVSVGHAKVLARGEYSSALDPEQRDKRNQDLKDSIYEGLGRIRGKASRKLMKVLNLINDETLENIPEKDKARIAAQMANQLSGVIDRTINKGESTDAGRSAHLHLYSPEQRPLAAFDIKRINPPEDKSANATSSTE